MEVQLEPGTYVVAVSGGVDSMTLLNMLSKVPKVRLVVAHFDHGIRPDSAADRELVQRTAADLGLPFVFHEGRLGEGASEAEARKARYDFLRKVRQAADAQAILTAHHQDDALETAVHHLLRGTGRKGLTALHHNSEIRRPLLHLTKRQLQEYALSNGLVWREDSTNDDLAYTRNFIRHQIIPRLSDQDKQKLLDTMQASSQRNREIDELLQEMVRKHLNAEGLERRWFIGLPHIVAREVMANWLRQNDVRDFDKKLIEQLVQAAKTLRSGGLANVSKGVKMRVNAARLALQTEER